MKRIFVTGAGGFVGARIMAQLSDRFELTACSSAALRAADGPALLREVERCAPDYIIHTAAISDTGYSQAHPDESRLANVELPLRVAEAARAVNAKLLCFSSDQVYTGCTGRGPFDERLELQPANVYGCHKLEAEKRVLDMLPGAVMLRATWMYDLPGYRLPIRGNMLLNLLHSALQGESQAYATNDYCGITYVRHVIEQLAQALDVPGGVYNFGSENALSMYDTARDFCAALGLKLDIAADSSRPERSLSMDCAKLRSAGVAFDDTQQGLRRCLADYGL